MDKLFERLNQIESKIPQVKNKTARKDLLKMVKTVDAAISAADKESVECRRLHRETLPPASVGRVTAQSFRVRRRSRPPLHPESLKGAQARRRLSG